jgi:cytochrome c oxidase subunit 4
MEQNHNENQHHPENTGFGIYILIWLGLISLTVITVSLAGLNLTGLTVITALTIATIKSALVMNYFMHIKYETMIFKVFIAVCIIIFIVMIVLTFFDLTYRPIQQ